MRWHLPAELGGQPGQLILQGRQAGQARAQPQPGPAVLEGWAQHPAGGRWRQDGVLDLVELVDQDWRDGHDRGDHEGLPAGRLAAEGLPVQPVELPGHPGADGGAEDVRHAAAQRDPAGVAGQPPGQYRHLVLPEVAAVQAADQVVGEERVTDPAIDHRVGVQPHPGRAAPGLDGGQPLDVPERAQEWAGHIDEHVTGIDRAQVARVGGAGAPRAGQRTQGRRAEQPADQGQGEHPPAEFAAAGPPVVDGGAHHAPRSNRARLGQLIMRQFSADCAARAGMAVSQFRGRQHYRALMTLCG